MSKKDDHEGIPRCVSCKAENEKMHMIRVDQYTVVPICIVPGPCIERAKKKGIWAGR